MSRIKVAIIYGGQSHEHEISIKSAKNILKYIDLKKYEVIPVYVDKEGNFSYKNQRASLIKEGIIILKNKNILKIDVIFPILHGPFGEDGSIQGLAKLYGYPCVGSGILSSSVCLNKIFTKTLLKDFLIADYVYFTKKNIIKYAQLGKNLVVKPNNQGSSLGISFVSSGQEYYDALKLAFKYSDKVIVEDQLKCREIECAILGDFVSEPGEVITNGFYDYNSKYNKSSRLKIPAKLSLKLTKKIKKLSYDIFKILNCKGMARIDFFIVGDKVYFNEVNTIPGFTDNSMYPKLLDYSGISFTELITKLIDLTYLK